MNVLKNVVLSIFTSTLHRRAFYLVVITLILIGDVFLDGKSRRTFQYFQVSDGRPVVEERNLPTRPGLENRVAQYVEEALLGPENVRLDRLFQKETKLLSVLIRDGEAFINLSAPAAVPVEGQNDVRRSLRTLERGIERSFIGIRKAAIFIDGQEPYSQDGGTEAPVGPA